VPEGGGAPAALRPRAVPDPSAAAALRRPIR
jgi:hypothetical protein